MKGVGKEKMKKAKVLHVCAPEYNIYKKGMACKYIYGHM